MKKAVSKRKKLTLCTLRKIKKISDSFDIGPVELELGELVFSRTGLACPEKYEIYTKNNEYLATVYLRQGHLSVYSPSKNIYYMDFDDWKMDHFRSQEERIKYLKDISNIVTKKELN